MTVPNIRTGTKLELEVYDENGEIIRPVYISQFESIDKDGLLVVLSPIREGILILIHRDARLNVIYETNGDLNLFEAVAVDRVKEGNIHMTRIRQLSDVRKIQRRSFFRYETIRDARYRVFFDLSADADERGDYVKSMTRDLSGGGVCILMEEKPEMGAYIDGFIQLKNEISFLGRVVRVILLEDAGRYKYEIGVMFTEISNRDRESIISFIFEAQRSLLKKGWST